MTIKILLLLTGVFCLSFCCLAQDPSEWRIPKLEDQVYVQTSEGVVVIELAPFIAPNHVKHFKSLVKEGFYDGLDFYRVIDGFVAQGGDLTGGKPTDFKQVIKAEFSRQIPEESRFINIQAPGFLAPETGYLNGFSAGRDRESQQEWLLQCPGNVSMARNTEVDSASTEFYIVIGQAPRHLDRNMSAIGRVIFGLNNVQRFKRAEMNSQTGIIHDPDKRSKIISMKMAVDTPEDQRLNIQVLKGNSSTNNKRLKEARTLENPFF